MLPGRRLAAILPNDELEEEPVQPNSDVPPPVVRAGVVDDNCPVNTRHNALTIEDVDR